jgi:hypothetical protein
MVYQPLSVDIQQQSLPYDTFSASYASKEYEFLNRFVASRIRNQSMSAYRYDQLSIDKFRLFTANLAYQILSVQVNQSLLGLVSHNVALHGAFMVSAWVRH